MTTSLPHARLPAGLSIGPVALTVSDLQRSVAFYQQVLGLVVQERSAATTTLGAGPRPLVRLTEVPGAVPPPADAAGLYHLALLLPTRADLARWVRHVSALGLRVGQSDHLVSEAFYLTDPDGHGIEVYRDRPRSDWRWNLDQVQMASDPIDIPGLLAEAGPAPFDHVPESTVMGHIHLRVSDLGAAEAFYRTVLGLDVVARWPGALFVSVGGYHHHLGLNTWKSEGGKAAPDGTTTLQHVHLTLPRQADISSLADRLTAAGHAFTLEGDTLTVPDPAGNRLIFGTPR